jgi:hypothetical protein
LGENVMAKPWEQYATETPSAPKGPWDQYKQPEPQFKDSAQPIDPGVPEWGRNNPRLYGVAGAAREVLGPLAEMAGMLGGGMAGAVTGPVTAVAGAGLGYGLGRQAARGMDLALGNARPSESIKDEASLVARNVGEGAAMEMGGQMIAPVIGGIIKGGAKVAGKAVDIFRDGGKLKAAEIVRKSLGPEFDAAKAALRAAPDDITAGQALADVNSPVTQAIFNRALERDPRFLTNLLGKQDAERFKQLTLVSKGGNQTAAREAQREMKDILNRELIPILETEIAAANIAGELAPKFAGQAARFGQAAADKVDDVRRFTEVQGRVPPAISASAQPVPPRYTYLGGDLMKRAEQVAADAAEGSLRFGEASQFANAALKSLEAHGLRPLKTETIVGRLAETSANPKFAGNRDVQTVLGRVADDLQQWTNSGGVIDAWALDSIRKNSVNSAVKALYPAAETKAQKELAAKVLGEVRPLIIDAVEAAGGTGYRGYLKAYTDGMQSIAQTKLGAEAMRLYQSSPKKFVELVEGNSPKAIEKIFGPGNYNIAKEMSKDAMARLKIVAKEVKRDINVAEQIKAGEVALNELLGESLSKFQIPNVLNPKVALANRGLRELEKKIGKDAMNELTAAAKSGRSMAELLDTLPAAQRSKVLKALSNPSEWMPVVPKSVGSAAAFATTNALAQ